MKEIGGYIELWENKGFMLHEGAIALNSARSCLKYLIQARGIKKILLPYYLCDSVACACQKPGGGGDVRVRYYHIDAALCPEEITIEADEWLYVVNYYGQMTDTKMRELAQKYCRVIVDNVQAYFAAPMIGVDTIYTCRKFFGVPDGAFLYTDVRLPYELKRDVSWDRMSHLLGRFEGCASDYYSLYSQNEEDLGRQPLLSMSKLSENLLRGVDYEFAKERRTENYARLDARLKGINMLNLHLPEGAFAYPLLLDNGAEVRKKLIAEHIYVPTLWPNVLEETASESWEHYLAQNLLPLPCDQRYGEVEMDFVCNEILGSKG